jgi:hypothetical protein
MCNLCKLIISNLYNQCSDLPIQLCSFPVNHVLQITATDQKTCVRETTQQLRHLQAGVTQRELGVARRTYIYPDLSLSIERLF